MAGNYVWTGLDAKTIANYFLHLGQNDEIPVDPLKLQKLIYLAHGWSLVFLRRPLVKGPIEAWRYGPVVPSLYKEFQKFGSSPIVSYAAKEPFESPYGIDEKSRSLLDSVWDRYKPLSPFQLSVLTNKPGTAWDLARRQGEIYPWGGPQIPNALIADEFARRQHEEAR